jgi:hypothetical protein
MKRWSSKWMSNVKAWIIDDKGIGTLEIIMIVAVIVIIAVAFRKWILAWIQQLFDSTNDELKRTSSDGLTVPTP